MSVIITSIQKILRETYNLGGVSSKYFIYFLGEGLDDNWNLHARYH